MHRGAYVVGVEGEEEEKERLILYLLPLSGKDTVCCFERRVLHIFKSDPRAVGFLPFAWGSWKAGERKASREDDLGVEWYVETH